MKDNCYNCEIRTKWWFWAMAYAWDVLAIGTTTYVVFWLDYSGWWYLLGIMLCWNSHDHDDDNVFE